MNVRWLDVPVNDLPRFEVDDSSYQLLYKRLHAVLGDCVQLGSQLLPINEFHLHDGRVISLVNQIGLDQVRACVPNQSPLKFETSPFRQGAWARKEGRVEHLDG